MESDNLRTASLYINNLLLSRGLLRNGQAIDFSRPDKAEGGLESTMGRIMSVVNDLVLKRDVCLLHVVSRHPNCCFMFGIGLMLLEFIAKHDGSEY
jgi:hypothetical protein